MTAHGLVSSESTWESETDREAGDGKSVAENLLLLLLLVVVAVL